MLLLIGILGFCAVLTLSRPASRSILSQSGLSTGREACATRLASPTGAGTAMAAPYLVANVRGTLLRSKTMPYCCSRSPGPLATRNTRILLLYYR